MVNKYNTEINITYEEALDILLQIPQHNFITQFYEDHYGDCCSIGHLCKALFNDAVPRGNANNINSVFLHESKIYTAITSPAQCLISQINDGRAMDYYHWKYNQMFPKQKVLAYLLDVVKAGKGNELVFSYE